MRSILISGQSATSWPIARGREAQWRPARLEGRPLRDVADWLEQYRRFWDESFQRLDEYLVELQTKEKPPARRKSRKR